MRCFGAAAASGVMVIQPHDLTETQMWHQVDPFLGQINRANVSTLIKQRIRMQA